MQSPQGTVQPGEDALRVARPARPCRPLPHGGGAGRGAYRTYVRTPMSSRPRVSLLPHVTHHGTQDDDGGHGDEPREDAEDDANRTVDPGVGRDRRREVERGEPLENGPQHRRHQSRKPKHAPWQPPTEQEAHRPPEEPRGDTEAEDDLDEQMSREGTRPRAD